MVLRDKNSITFLYQYKFDIILEKLDCNGICLLCRVIIGDCGGWCNIFVRLAVELATDSAVNIAIGLATIKLIVEPIVELIV